MCVFSGAGNYAVQEYPEFVWIDLKITCIICLLGWLDSSFHADNGC